ncbi:MAG: triose-phosphate isomerase [Bacteroidetes bacterium]|jgi:triosephosphate isomerase|nr:triose-phosphate isomerase [Bacteroidota bacterium]
MLIAGNWKMNTDLSKARTLAAGVRKAAESAGEVEVLVCPPFISLDAVCQVMRGSAVQVGGQTLYPEDSGAFTGEVSAPMLRSVGCSHVIVGHSERRQLFGETDEDVNTRLLQARLHDLVPILCVGETLQQRKAGNQRTVVEEQLTAALANVDIAEADDLVVAYEPVWAIGTGETASPEQAQAMHAFIRSRLTDRLGQSVGAGVAILYGGSMKPHNADELLSQDDVDGGLIGGASLKASDFGAIINVATGYTA